MFEDKDRNTEERIDEIEQLLNELTKSVSDDDSVHEGEIVDNDRVFVKTARIGRPENSIKELLYNFIINILLLAVVSIWGFGLTFSPKLMVILVALLLTLFNRFIKPILVLISLPITIMSFGFFYLLINAFGLYLIDIILGNAFVINSFLSAFVSSIIIAILKLMFDYYFKRITIS